MRASLASLPVEIIENISWRGDGVYGLRAACRELQDKSWHVVRERYFETRQIWLQRDSLQTLWDMSCNARVAPLVRRIIVSPHAFHKSYVDELDFEGSFEGENAYRRQYNDQQFLIQSGAAVEYLTNILLRLPACEEINTHWEGEWENFAPDRRDTTEETENWRLSNSMANLHNRIHYPPMLTHNGQHPPGYLVTLWLFVLGSLIKTLNLPLRKLAFTGAGSGDRTFLPSEAFSCITKAQARQLRPHVVNIQDLALDVDSVASDQRSLWNADFSTFLGAFENLSSLHLGFPPRSRKPLITVFDVLPIFPHLYSLSLSNAHVRPQDLLDLLIRHKHVLKSLALNGIRLVRGNWKHLLIAFGQELALDTLRVKWLHQYSSRVSFDNCWPLPERLSDSQVNKNRWSSQSEFWDFVANNKTFDQDLARAVNCLALRPDVPGDLRVGEYLNFEL
ncbi:hypothetical protein EJ08DRAFT_240440 [Tothia fuscella]|uniref:Uncharacterized protein n=1 Tax=Tothia fuscella TaxID=1048955 RepID=A0A9P4NQS5_9PEZI|nr:hypothetical protein EJ08DRAFT_240440 [Tothia fuscella]